MPRASRSYCKSTPISKMGFTQRSSCKAQGFIKRSGKTNKGKYVKSRQYRQSIKRRSYRSIKRKKSFRRLSKKRSKRSRNRVRKSPSRVRKSPSRVQKSSSRVRKSPSRVRKSPSRVRKSPIKVMKHMIKSANNIGIINSENNLYSSIIPYIKNQNYDVDEKYFTMEYPLIRESLLKKDLGLLGEIIKRVKVIEGPITLVGLNPTNKLKEIIPTAPQIMLLGDYHASNKRCDHYVNIRCSLSEGCYTLYKSRQTNSFVQLLDSLAEKNKIGLFLEKNLMSDDEKKIDRFADDSYIGDSSLGHTTNQLYNCFGKRTNKNSKCAVKNLEVHSSDPRKDYDEEDNQKYQADIIIDMFNKAIKSIFMTPLDYMKRVHQKYFSNVSFKEMMLAIKTIFTETLGYNKAFWNSELFNKYSRTKRQIKKLPLELQNILKEYTINKIDFLMYERPFYVDPGMSTEFDKSFIRVLESLIQKKNPESSDLSFILYENQRLYDNIFYNINLNQDILDLYFIARTLRPAFKFDLAVGYFGQFHIQRMIDFLTRKDLYEKIFYYGPNNKYLVDEETQRFLGTNPKDHLKLARTSQKYNYKCIPLT